VSVALEGVEEGIEEEPKSEEMGLGGSGEGVVPFDKGPLFSLPVRKMRKKRVKSWGRGKP